MAESPWKVLKRRDPLTLSAEELKKEMKVCATDIQRCEEDNANFEARLTSGVHEWTQQEVEEQMKWRESLVRLLQQQMAACQTKLQEYEALTSSENREKFVWSTKQESVAICTISGIMSGFTGSGKTHTLAMVAKEEPPSLRVSTPVSQVPVRTITRTRFCKDKASLIKMSDNEFTDAVLLSAKESASKAAGGITFRVKSGLHKLVSKPSEPTDQVEKQLIVKFGTLDESTMMSLEGRVIMEISDCGGQPQFLEILPRYIESIDFSILVTNLSQHFDEYPINYFFNKEGKSVGKGVQSSLTNEQVIRLHLQMVASLSQGGKSQGGKSQGGKRPIIAIVGTHRDLEGKCIYNKEEGKCKHEGECVSPRQEKNRLLMKMVESFGLENNVISKTHSELIFAINAKTPEDVDRQTVDQLVNSILMRRPPHTENISLSYHALELTLKRKARESGHLAFSESVLLKEMSNYYFSKESLKDALRYLHKKRRVFYYEKVFPGLVLGEPQAVLNKQTELVVYSIQLASNTEMLNKEQWRFVKYGFFTIEILKQFSDHYVEGIFVPEDMLKLFVKLLMISEVEGGEYLMPCILPTDPLASCNPEPSTQSVPPMVLHFLGGPVQYGVFCGIICHVMTKSKWKVMINSKEREPFHVTRNSVHFCLPGYIGKVTLNDPFDSFFVVTVHVPAEASPYSEVVSHLCMEVRDTLLDAIAKVTAKLNYSAAPPTVAFLCTEHDDLHPATRASVGDTLLCTHAMSTKGGSLTTGHKVWLRDSSSTEPYPDLNPLNKSSVSDSLSLHPVSGSTSTVFPSSSTLNVIKWQDEQGQEQTFRLVDIVSAQWQEFGLQLGLKVNQLEAWRQECFGSVTLCWNKVMDHWLNGNCPNYSPTWEGLYTLLRDNDYGVAAMEMKTALDNTYSSQ